MYIAKTIFKFIVPVLLRSKELRRTAFTIYYQNLFFTDINSLTK